VTNTQDIFKLRLLLSISFEGRKKRLHPSIREDRTKNAQTVGSCWTLGPLVSVIVCRTTDASSQPYSVFQPTCVKAFFLVIFFSESTSYPQLNGNNLHGRGQDFPTESIPNAFLWKMHIVNTSESNHLSCLERPTPNSANTRMTFPNQFHIWHSGQH
jgi:hypothetical protein